MVSIVIVDDPGGSAAAFHPYLGRRGHEVTLVPHRDASPEMLRRLGPDLLLYDLDTAGDGDLESFRRLQPLHAPYQVLTLGRPSACEAVVALMQSGVFEHLTKPVDSAAVEHAVECAMRHRSAARARTHSAGGSCSTVLVGESPAMQQVFQTIGRVARSNVTVLICGESGTGKELVARAIHRHSSRDRGPFVPVNCAAIPDTLLENELFGHERGAFTGAQSRRLGRFEQAAGGTLFLDEVGDMTLPTQAKLLRVLQEQALERLGGNELIRTDVRILAATHRNLREMRRAGRFRDDLYYRLDVVTLRLPPLRDRRGDIPLLVEHVLAGLSRELDRDIRAAPQTLERLQHHHWAGNVRELEHCLQCAALMCRGDVILPEDIRLEGDPAHGDTHAANGEAHIAALVRRLLDDKPGSVMDELIRLTETSAVREALRRCGGNLSRAAALLGVSRPTIREKVRRLQVGFTPREAAQRR